MQGVCLFIRAEYILSLKDSSKTLVYKGMSPVQKWENIGNVKFCPSQIFLGPNLINLAHFTGKKHNYDGADVTATGEKIVFLYKYHKYVYVKCATSGSSNLKRSSLTERHKIYMSVGAGSQHRQSYTPENNIVKKSL